MINYQELERQDTEDDSNIVVSLEYIGEGLSGDYDEEDPEDVPLLRF